MKFSHFSSFQKISRVQKFVKFCGYGLSRMTWTLRFRGYKLSRTTKIFEKSRKFVPAKLSTFKVVPSQSRDKLCFIAFSADGDWHDNLETRVDMFGLSRLRANFKHSYKGNDSSSCQFCQLWRFQYFAKVMIEPPSSDFSNNLHLVCPSY